MSAPVILEVDITRKSFAGRDGAAQLVLEDLRFRLAPREIVAVVGPSGCGKTTLLRLIDGLDHDFTGRIVWHATDRPRIGTVFQEPRLLPWRTVRQNLTLVAAGRDALADELLHALGLWPFRDAYPPQISLGMARRAAIARAFAIDPDLVLLDEPFVSLDPTMTERGRDVLLDAWRRRPTAALIVTHDMDDAAALADRVLLLSANPARIVADVAIPPDQRRAGPEAAHVLAQSLRQARAAEVRPGGAISGSSGRR